MLTLAQGNFSHYGPVALLLIMAIGMAITMLLLRYIGPSRLGDVKGVVYESGMNPISSAKRRFNVRFYVVAMTFLVFDVEIIFLYPWATVFPSLGGDYGNMLEPMFLGRMLFFVLTSVVAFVYAWKKGVFRYD